MLFDLKGSTKEINKELEELKKEYKSVKIVAGSASYIRDIYPHWSVLIEVEK